MRIVFISILIGYRLMPLGRQLNHKPASQWCVVQVQEVACNGEGTGTVFLPLYRWCRFSRGREEKRHSNFSIH